MIKERLSGNVILIQYPVNEGTGFNSIIDVLKMKMLRYAKEGGKAEVVEIPAEHADRAAELHSALVEKAAESDESLMEIFFTNDTLSEAEIGKGIAKGIVSRGMFPVFCISAKHNIGVDQLMEFVVNEAPSITDMPAPLNNKGNEIKANPSGPASIYIFKSSIEEHIGEIHYFRVYSGKITENLDVVNSNNNSKERLSQLYVCAGKNRTRVPELNTGDIGAIVKLKNTKTQQTLNAPGNDWKYVGVVFAEPKYRVAIKAQSESDDEKLGEALHKLHLEDPTIIIEYSKELKQIIIHGQGEYHLNIMKWHLDNIYKIPTNFNAPKIPYRETITKSAHADYRHRKQSGGVGAEPPEVARELVDREALDPAVVPRLAAVVAACAAVAPAHQIRHGIGGPRFPHVGRDAAAGRTVVGANRQVSGERHLRARAGHALGRLRGFALDRAVDLILDRREQIEALLLAAPALVDVRPTLICP
jgi:elongation factor G